MKYTKSQELAIKLSGQNILVSAGAGSGKTGVLKARVVHKLLNGMHIDEMIILTFTNAAAFEMKDRIIQAVNENPSLESELDRIDNAIISTFDAFCLKLVKEYHYLLGLESNITIGDKIQFLSMEKEVLENTIKNYYLKNDKDFNDLVISLFQKGDSLIYDTVRNLADKLMKEPKYFDKISNFEELYLSEIKLNNHLEEFKEIINSKIESSYKAYQNAYKELNGYNTKVDEYLEKMENYYINIRNQDFTRIIDVIKGLSFPQKVRASKEDDYLKEVSEYHHSRIKANIEDIKKLFKDLDISKEDDLINNVLNTKKMVLKIIEIANEYIKNIQLKKEELSLYSFQDIMDLATRLLEENISIRNHYKNSIKEIMIDEYQDTNDLQEYFVSLISQDNLFMVGDIKQSIYGFREANPKNFLKKYYQYSNNQGGTLIDLRENFRSREEVLKDINTVFWQVMDQEIGGINYQDNQSLIYGLKDFDNKYPNQKYGVELIKYDLESSKDDNPNLSTSELESNLLAKDIRRRIDNNYQIFDLKNKDFRNIKYSDIAILIDRKTDFFKISEILSKYSIPINLYSDEPFINSPEMLFLINYLKLIYCFIDFDYRINNFHNVFYGVARSFVFKYTDEEILDFIINSEGDYLNELKTSPFKDIYEYTVEISNQINDLPVFKILELIYLKLDIYRMISLLDNPRKKEEKLDFFVNTVRSFDNFNFINLIDYLEEIEENPDWDIDYSDNHSQEDAVVLMTMHKSKGLQFPIVYCPGLYKGFNITENKDFFIYDKKYGLITQCFDEGFVKTYLRYLSLYNTQKEYVSERLRLLYVAFTRAKENLILFGDVALLEQSRYEIDNNYINYEDRLKYKRYTDVLSSSSIIHNDVISFNNNQVSLNNNDFINDINESLIFNKFNYEKIEVEKARYSKSQKSILDETSKQAIEYGNYVHRLLENFDFSDIDNSLNRLPTNIRNSYKKLIESEIFDFSKKPNIYQEYEFYLNKNNIVRRGIIDLLVVYDDCVYIIDYKLKNINDLAYVEQLKGYKEYIENKANKPTYTYLYSITDQILNLV
jgi:ATP-dependent helicase/nuclease subunit A